MWDDHELFCSTNLCWLRWPRTETVSKDIHKNTRTQTPKTPKKQTQGEIDHELWCRIMVVNKAVDACCTKIQHKNTKTKAQTLKHVRWPWWSRWPWTNNAPTDWLCCRGLLSRKSGGQRQIASYGLWQHTLDRTQDCSSQVPTINPCKLKKETERRASLPL